MTYQTLNDIERFAGRLEAEKIAARYTAMERIHVERVREAIDELERLNKESTMRAVWRRFRSWLEYQRIYWRLGRGR